MNYQVSSIAWIKSNQIARIWWHFSLFLFAAYALASIMSLGQYGHSIPLVLLAPSLAIGAICLGFRYRITRIVDVVRIERLFYGYSLAVLADVHVHGAPFSVVRGHAKDEIRLVSPSGAVLPVYAAGRRGHDALIIGLAMVGLTVNFEDGQLCH